MRKKNDAARIMEHDAEFLADAICSAIRGNSEKRFCFILGAGASVESGIPSGQTLSYQWMEKLMKNQRRTERAAKNLKNSGKMTHEIDEIVKHWKEQRAAGKTTLGSKYYFDIFAMIEEVYEGGNGQVLIRDMVKNKFPSYGYVTLAKLLAHESGNNLVITTNFDDLMEQALSLYTDATPIVANHEALADFVNNPNCKIPLIAKIHHGVLYNPLNNPKDTNQLNEKWGKMLDNIFGVYTPVVIGYGGGDHSLMDYLKTHNLKNKILWCAYKKAPDETDIQKAVRKSDGSFVVHDGFNDLMYKVGWKVFGGKIKPENVRKDAENRLEKRREKIQEQMQKMKTETETGKALDYFLRAYELAEQKDYDGAIENYTKAIELNPNDAIAYNNRGNAYCNKGECDKAIADYNKAIELDPKEADYYNNRGFAYAKMGRFGEALKDCNQALEIDPNCAEAYDSRGIVYEKMDKLKEALADYDKALELNHDLTETKENRERVLALLRKKK